MQIKATMGYNFKHIRTVSNKNSDQGTSLVVQWLRIRLPMQGT